jgi:hypothetical protein
MKYIYVTYIYTYIYIYTERERDVGFSHYFLRVDNKLIKMEKNDIMLASGRSNFLLCLNEF